MKHYLFLLDADHAEINGKSIIRLWCKTKDGKTVLAFDTSFEPYFYILPRAGKANDVEKRIWRAMEKEKGMKVLRVEKVKRKLKGEESEFLKVFCDLPVNLSKIRELVKAWEDTRGLVVEEYEYAMPFYRRYLIDKRIAAATWIDVEGEEIREEEMQTDITLHISRINEHEEANGFEEKLKIFAFDIECFEEAGKNKIIMISIAGEGFKKVLTYEKDHYPNHVEVLSDEKALLERFVEIIKEQDPDILLGYNTDGFDFQIIADRAEELRVSLELSRDRSLLKFARRARITSARLIGRVHVDLFGFVNHILAPQLQTEVLSLDAVSAELLGDKKIEFQFEEILEAWRKKKDLAKLAEYCLKDSELVLRLAHLLLPQIFALSQITGQLPFDTSRMTYGQLVEWYLSKRAYEKNEIILNQPKFEEIESRRQLRPYTGAFVREPLPGVHEGIAVMDFKSLYPSIIVSFNISPETLDCECCKGDGYIVPELKHWFCKKKKGFVASVVKELFEKRVELKQKMKKARIGSEEYQKLDNEQFAVKTIMNASYGMMGFAGAKWYCRECAESTAAWARFYIKQVMELAEKASFIVVYGDTDSMFVKLAKEDSLKRITEKFLEETNEKLPGIMELELQGFYVRGIFIPRGIGPGTAKKRYALIDDKGKLTIRGLEKVRRDWSEAAKSTQEKVLRFILEKEDVQGAVKYVRGVIENLKAQKISLRDLTIYEQLTKPLSEYKLVGPHVIAARKIKERGRPIGAGMVIMFIITKGKTGKESISERAEPAEDVLLKNVDVEYYTTHQIIPAALRVLAVLGVTEDELLGKAKQRRLA